MIIKKIHILYHFYPSEKNLYFFDARLFAGYTAHMISTPSTKLITVAIGCMVLVSVFHICVLIGIIPYTIVWGGRLQNATQMAVFETVSLTVNVFIIFVLANAAGYSRLLSKRVVSFFCAILSGIFALNTVRNLLSVSVIEKILFTPLTAILAIVFFLLARRQQ